MMTILKRTEAIGSLDEDSIPPIDTPPPNVSLAPSVKEWVPQNVDEYERQRESISRATTDTVARWILIGCVCVIGVSLLVEFVADWVGVSLDSPRIDGILDIIKYIALTIMGYLFGKNVANRSG